MILGVINEKGGTGKSTTTASLGATLTQMNKKALLIDIDPQASLSLSLGFRDTYPITVNDIFSRRIHMQEPLHPGEGILHHPEGMDILPSSHQLAHTMAQIGDTIGRESILRKYLDPIRNRYDHILIDCPPTLSHLTINAMTAAQGIIIPVEADYLSVQGLQRHLYTIREVQDNLNSALRVEGILITMLDARSNFAREMTHRIRMEIGSSIPVFKTAIPKSIKVVEASAAGVSILAHAPMNPVAEAYRQVAKEIMRGERQRSVRKPNLSR